MGYELTIVRLKRNRNLYFPAAIDTEAQNPIAGPFDTSTKSLLMQAVRCFPYVHQIRRGQDRYEIETPFGGRLEVYMTSDGHLFLESQAALELALALFRGLSTVTPDIAIEDPARGVLHDADSFRAWIDGESDSSVHAAAH